jgi:hypothetical protein
MAEWVNWLALSTRKKMEIGEKVSRFFHDERYVDPDGVVWVGRGEDPNEVWIVESGSDEGYMTKDEMLIKMAEEIARGGKENNGA